jgi:hypothetical protein
VPANISVVGEHGCRTNDSGRAICILGIFSLPIYMLDAFGSLITRGPGSDWVLALQLPNALGERWQGLVLHSSIWGFREQQHMSCRGLAAHQGSAPIWSFQQSALDFAHQSHASCAGILLLQVLAGAPRQCFCLLLQSSSMICPLPYITCAVATWVT